MDHEQICAIPKAELHLHIEGTLEPELMLKLARRNNITLTFADEARARAAYNFTDLQSFLDIYYQGCAVLITERDFHDLAWAYIERAVAQGVRHAEIFFDPQSHTERGVPYAVVVRGLHSALAQASAEYGFSSGLILCFLRHLSADAAMATLDEALVFRDLIIGVGLDSSEVGHPPEKFAKVFATARAQGLHAVAHAGEEGPPEYVWQALDVLGAERIDHGVRCLEDEALVRRLSLDRIPLTVCPLSNVALRVVERLEDHMLPEMLQRGILATLNSDDPAYFGGYIGDNFEQVARRLALSDDELVALARNSFEASFLDNAARNSFLTELDSHFQKH